MYFFTFLLLHVKRHQSKIDLCLQKSWLSSWPAWSLANHMWFKYVTTHQFVTSAVFDVFIFSSAYN